jgi:DNA-binding NarL/FixJ family response regulator
MKKVIIIEDDIIIAEMIQKAINNLGDYSCDKYFLNPVEYFNADETPEIILLDLIMPEMDGLDAIDLILNKNPSVSIIINSIKDDTDTIFSALQKGAVGYIDKQSFNNNLLEVFKAVENGGAYMTPKIAKKVMEFFNRTDKKFEKLSDREIEIANAIVEGLSYKIVADRFSISIDTVRTHIKNIYKKLNINSKSELFKIYNVSTASDINKKKSK